MDEGYVASSFQGQNPKFPCEDLPRAPIIAPLLYEFSTSKRLDPGLGLFELHSPYQCQDIRVISKGKFLSETTLKG